MNFSRAFTERTPESPRNAPLMLDLTKLRKVLVPAMKLSPALASEAALSELTALAARVPWQLSDRFQGHSASPLEERQLGMLGARVAQRGLGLLGEPPEGYWQCRFERLAEGAAFGPAVLPPNVPGRVHVRLELVVTEATRGGELRLEGDTVPLRPGDALLFRADDVPFHVTNVDEGSRLVFVIAAELPPGRWATRDRAGPGRRFGCCR